MCHVCLLGRRLNYSARSQRNAFVTPRIISFPRKIIPTPFPGAASVDSFKSGVKWRVETAADGDFPEAGLLNEQFHRVNDAQITDKAAWCFSGGEAKLTMELCRVELAHCRSSLTRCCPASSARRSPNKASAGGMRSPAAISCGPAMPLAPAPAISSHRLAGMPTTGAALQAQGVVGGAVVCRSHAYSAGVSAHFPGSFADGKALVGFWLVGQLPETVWPRGQRVFRWSRRDAATADRHEVVRFKSLPQLITWPGRHQMNDPCRSATHLALLMTISPFSTK